MYTATVLIGCKPLKVDTDVCKSCALHPSKSMCIALLRVALCPLLKSTLIYVIVRTSNISRYARDLETTDNFQLYTGHSVVQVPGIRYQKTIALN